MQMHCVWAQQASGGAGVWGGGIGRHPTMASGSGTLGRFESDLATPEEPPLVISRDSISFLVSGPCNWTSLLCFSPVVLYALVCYAYMFSLSPDISLGCGLWRVGAADCSEPLRRSGTE